MLLAYPGPIWKGNVVFGVDLVGRLLYGVAPNRGIDCERVSRIQER
jgi:hypothetical protein